jgi:alpha-1,3-mannosyltransferase
VAPRVETPLQWLWGTLVLSIAASIKMNALLLLPGLVFLLVRNVGLARGALYLSAAVVVQAAIGAPFLLTHPGPYVGKAFELSRVFFHTWTVNWKFLPEDVFVSPRVATGLLAGQLGTLLVLGAYRWCEHDGGLLRVLTRVGLLPAGVERLLVRVTGSSIEGGHGAGTTAAPKQEMGPAPARGHQSSSQRGGSSTPASLRGRERRPDSASAERHSSSASTNAAVAPTPNGLFRDAPAFVAYVLCISNFAGIAFARTLHYQFYTWYFHTLPLLYMVAGLPLPVMVALSGGIEYAFNVGDASGAGSPLSSAVLQACHFLLLGALLAAKPPLPSAGSDSVVSVAKGKQA